MLWRVRGRAGPARNIIARDGEDAVVRLEIPGVDVEKDVTVEIEDARLVVRGERRDKRVDERDGRSLREVRYGAFRRSFGLPPHVTADAVAATYDAGVPTSQRIRADVRGAMIAARPTFAVIEPR